MRILSIHNLSYSVSKGLISNTTKIILKQISFEIEEGEILAIAGESGGGKTTLAKIVAGIIKEYTGEISFNEKGIFDNKQIQLLPQNSREILNPLRKIKDLLIDPLPDLPKIEIENKIKSLLKLIEFDEEILEKFAFNLSGGELQRIALGRILLVEPKILILDEPFSAQDVVAQCNLIQLLKEINKGQRKTLIVVSHNLSAMKNFADRIIVLKNGEIIENDTCENIIKNPKSEYTMSLMNSEKFHLK